MRTLIKSKKLCGQAIIAYLRSKGHPEVALLFVEDDRERFEVALECGNIEVALAAAQRLGDSDILGRLGTEAFRQVCPLASRDPGRHALLESACYWSRVMRTRRWTAWQTAQRTA